MAFKTIPVPDLIWTSLRGVLDANMQHMVKDIAKTLNKDPAPLLQEIKKKVDVYLFDESSTPEIDMRCSFICQTPAAPLFCQPCGRPILWSSTSERCAEHAYHPKVAYSLPVLHPVKTETDTYFVAEDDTVYTVDYEPVGTYDRLTKRLTVFTVLE